MPLREYRAREGMLGCPICRKGFERLEPMATEPRTQCPQCGSPVARVLSAPRVGSSQSGMDHRAKAAGFHKLKRLGHGEYEKQY